MSLIHLKSQSSSSESMYRTMIENSTDSILIVSGSNIVYANTVTAKLCGYQIPDEIIGKDALGFISQRYREQFRERIKSRLGGEPQPVRFDHEIVRKDGSIVQVETAASLIKYCDSPAVLFIGRDITERKRLVSMLFTLHEYAARLNAAETIADISEATLGAVTTVMGFRLANFMLMEEDSLCCIDNVGFEGTYWDVPISGEGVIPLAARERNTILANELGVDADREKSLGIQSQLASPVMVQGKMEAVIEVESTDKGAFLDSDIQILEVISLHVASALERIGNSG
jgi:PAS domain S-box-containing protein